MWYYSQPFQLLSTTIFLSRPISSQVCKMPPWALCQGCRQGLAALISMNFAWSHWAEILMIQRSCWLLFGWLCCSKLMFDAFVPCQRYSKNWLILDAEACQWSHEWLVNAFGSGSGLKSIGLFPFPWLISMMPIDEGLRIQDHVHWYQLWKYGESFFRFVSFGKKLLSVTAILPSHKLVYPYYSLAPKP